MSDHLPVFTFLSEKVNVEDKKTWSLIEKNRVLTSRDLELSFNSIAGKIYLMIILVMHICKIIVCMNNSLSISLMNL